MAPIAYALPRARMVTSASVSSNGSENATSSSPMVAVRLALVLSRAISLLYDV